MMRIRVLLPFLCLGLLPSAAFSQQAAPSPGKRPAPPTGLFVSAAPEAPAAAGTKSDIAEGKALFDRKCGVCHNAERASYLRANRERWVATVKSMQGKRSGFISDAEAEKIVAYLVDAFGK